MYMKMEKKIYPTGEEFYNVYEEIGQGVSASVHRALCKPLNEIVAIKILDFERENADLTSIYQEVQTMVLAHHPNVLKSHCSFVKDQTLWIVMPFMEGGSCLHIMKAAYSDGFEEVVIATILREVLKGIEYLHQYGHIHRDIKAGNILIDSRGAIKLGDFGVSACLFDSGDRQRMRNTFVGTPCWMAPEVMEQLNGYDFKADIWSFAITALELAHGHAPFSKYPPMKVLMMTLQNAPPGLDYERDKKFSRSFRHMLANCLVKDPSKRPSAFKLLEHSFFKKARSNDYIARTILDGLPVLGDRIKALKRKEADMLAQKKMPDGKMEELSQNEYKRGISGWNFNLDDLRNQASLSQGFDESISEISETGGSSNSLSTLDVQEKNLQYQNSSEFPDTEENIDVMRSQPLPSPSIDFKANHTTDGKKSNNDSKVSCSCYIDDQLSNSSSGELHLEINKRILGNTFNPCQHRRCVSSNSLILQDVKFPLIKRDSYETEKNMVNANMVVHSESYSKDSKSSAINDEEQDEKAKALIVQQRGRFKVTSENSDEKTVSSPILHKSRSLQVITSNFAMTQPSNQPIPVPSSSHTIPSTFSSNSIYPALQSILQANIVQREDILNLMKQETFRNYTGNSVVDEGGMATTHITAAAEKSLLEAAHDREKSLLYEITELQWRIICAQDELRKLKSKNTG